MSVEQKSLVTKTEMKAAMRLNPGLTEKLMHKAELVSNLTDVLDGINQFASHMVGSYKKTFQLRKQVQIEMLQVIGAIAGEYKKQYGQPLFSEYVDYRHYEELEGEARTKTVGQMCEILRIADECCREVWGDYLLAEGDAYMAQ